MNQNLKGKIKESFSAVMPITAVVFLLSIIMVPMDIGTIMLFLAGAVLLIIGMGFFQLGAEITMTPLGEGIGTQMSKTRKTGLVLLIGFVMGVLITIAEPDLQVLAEQVPSIPNYVLIFTVAVGVGLFLVMAILRILLKIKLSNMLFVFYIGVFVLAYFVPKDFLSVAFDSGGVTTGPITVPFIMAMGVGLASLRGDKNASEDSFGLVALSSIGPILAVMLLGIFYNPSDTQYTKVEVPQVETTRDLVKEFFTHIPDYAKEVLLALLPLVAVFFIFQLITKRYKKRQRIRMLVGYVYTFLGLVLFLTGVNVGFSPVGQLLGSELAAQAHLQWLLIPLGMLIGFFIVKAEPAVQVLNRQVEDVTDGAISQRAMNTCLSIGVAVSVGLSMLRVLTGISIFWLLIPGYAIALIASKFVPKIFVGIAFDSGGVASGPMTTTFLLPLAMGACEMCGGDVMTDAFGVVAMVAMTPLIAVQVMGLIYAYKQKAALKTEEEADQPVLLALKDDNDIIDFEEVTEDE